MCRVVRRPRWTRPLHVASGARWPAPQASSEPGTASTALGEQRRRSRIHRCAPRDLGIATRSPGASPWTTRWSRSPRREKLPPRALRHQAPARSSSEHPRSKQRRSARTSERARRSTPRAGARRVPEQEAAAGRPAALRQRGQGRVRAEELVRAAPRMPAEGGWHSATGAARAGRRTGRRRYALRGGRRESSALARRKARSRRSDRPRRRGRPSSRATGRGA